MASKYKELRSDFLLSFFLPHLLHLRSISSFPLLELLRILHLSAAVALLLLPPSVVQMEKKSFSPHWEPSCLVEPRHRLLWLDIALLNQISTDQIARPVEAVGTMHSDQTPNIHLLEELLDNLLGRIRLAVQMSQRFAGYLAKI